jgi:hypothetical protein
MSRQSLRLVPRLWLIQVYRKKSAFAPKTPIPPQDPALSEGHLGGEFFWCFRGYGPFFHALA